MDQLIELFDQFDLCQICHILRLPSHAEDVLSIPSHPIAKNLSDLSQSEPICAIGGIIASTGKEKPRNRH
jgi:hypothetical protein